MIEQHGIFKQLQLRTATLNGDSLLGYGLVWGTAELYKKRQNTNRLDLRNCVV